MGSTEEPERKRRHSNHSNSNSNHSSMSPPLKKQPLVLSPDDKKVDVSMLQYQNQKLAQQLDVQKNEIHALETRYNQLKSRQASYDNTLASVHNAWEELVDNLELLAVRANAPANGLKVLQKIPASRGKETEPSFPPAEPFLQRLLATGATDNSNRHDGDISTEGALECRKMTTVRTMENLVQAIDAQRARNDDLFQSVSKGIPSDENGLLLAKIDGDMREELINVRSVMDALHLKHRELALEIQLHRDNYTRDQAAISRLKGELEETIADLEMTRRKLASLKSQKDGVPSQTCTMPGMKIEGRDKSSKGYRDLETSLEEAKTLASQRLAELQEAHQEKLELFQQLQNLQDSLCDKQHLSSSGAYILLNDQVQHLKAELDRLQSLVNQLQIERDNALSHEKEAILKAEAGEAAQKINTISSARIAELELRLDQCMAERNELESSLEELSKTLDQKDEATEFKVMVSTLHKEMRMMQQQLDKYKEAACGAHSLRAEVQSLTANLERKTSEYKKLMEKVGEQVIETNSLKDEVQRMQESEQELKLILDMYCRESNESREIRELKERECRAWAQVERLKAALDEHSLELRVKAANEAEAACQQRLAAAEAEIAKLRQKLDASNRAILDLKEALKTKSEEGDAYLAEIETIGQAYEDTQTQNQRLLQQISERDDYNIKLVSESIKAKQLQASLLEEKQVLANRAQHAITVGECYKQRVTHLEEQVRAYVEQLGKATDESKQFGNALETAKHKILEVEKESLSAKSALEATEKELEQRRNKITDIQRELEKERFEKRRMQDELVALNIKATRFNAQNEGGSFVEKLQEEIKEYKAVLKCGVCHDRPKEVVITKCYHLFCSPCIQRNLEIRHRKCPGCGVPFGQNDVKNVYI